MICRWYLELLAWMKFPNTDDLKGCRTQNTAVYALPPLLSFSEHAAVYWVLSFHFTDRGGGKRPELHHSFFGPSDAGPLFQDHHWVSESDTERVGHGRLSVPGQMQPPEEIGEGGNKAFVLIISRSVCTGYKRVITGREIMCGRGQGSF